MAVNVTLFPLLARRAASKQEHLSVPYRTGLRVRDIVAAEGFSETDAEAIMVLVNDRQGDLDGALNDGDQVELRIAIAGGA